MVGGAKYTEDLKRFHQLQDEYLLIVNNDIKSVVDLVDFIGEQEEKIQQIEDIGMLSVCTGQVTHALLTRPPLFSEENRSTCMC